MSERDCDRRTVLFWRFVQKRPVIALTLLFSAAAAVVLWHNDRVSRTVVQTTALQDARLYSEAIGEFRTLYSSEVVEAAQSQGITVSHDYKEHAGAIPLPATLSMQLGQRIGMHRSGAETRLYSPYPFPWRQQEGGLRDGFARRAWEHFQHDPDTPFYDFQQQEGRQVLRYATADTMRASCVNCHNSHPDSPKTDWKVGDVRGVLEVVLPMDDVQAQMSAGIRESLALVAFIVIAGVTVLAVVIGRLRSTTDNLEDRMRELEVRDRELRESNELLIAARDEALASSRSKSQFLGTMSHELRTPLNAIIGYCEMLQEDADEQGESQLTEDLERIHQSATGLLGIIDDILEVSKLETGRSRLEVESCDVAAMVQDVVETVEPAIAQKGLRFERDIGREVGRITNDPVKLRMCLLHLLSNAAKFTREGTIRFQVRRESTGDGDWMRFTVSDTGIGMSRDQVHQLFEPFTQADGSSTRSHGGAGLGLAITHRFCRLMGGAMDVQSTPGEGTTMTFRVPVDVAATAGESEKLFAGSERRGAS